MTQPYILVLYFSRYGSTQKLAQLIGRGIESNGEFEAKLRTVPPVSPDSQASVPEVPDSGAIYCSQEDLKYCSGLALGSPTRFGNMSAPLKYFLDCTGAIWASGDLVDKPFATFTSSNSLHGGQESTLLTMAIPMLHHGMIYCGIPYSETSLSSTKTGVLLTEPAILQEQATTRKSPWMKLNLSCFRKEAGKIISQNL